MNYVILGVLLFVLGGDGLTPSPATADVFCDNLKQVAATLPQNTSSSPLQFATAIVGQAPNVVYALAFCQGDYNATACGECVTQVFNATPPPAPDQQCYRGFYSYKACPVFWSGDNIVDPSNTTQAYDDSPVRLTYSRRPRPPPLHSALQLVFMSRDPPLANCQSGLRFSSNF